MKKIAIIPARSGSKRIPGKNIKKFCGKPIISYSINTALESNLFDKIIVSTDSEEIAEVAKRYGAEIPFIRPKKLADDYTGTNDVIKHALMWFNENGVKIDYACCIYATAPFIRIEFLEQGIKMLTDTGKSFAFSVTTFPFPIQRAIRINKNGFIEAVYPENIFKRSQDLEEAYHDAGQFYWGRAEAFLQDKLLFSPESVPVILPRYMVQDIDTMEDWLRAEIMYNYLITNNS